MEPLNAGPEHALPKAVEGASEPINQSRLPAPLLPQAVCHVPRQQEDRLAEADEQRDRHHEWQLAEDVADLTADQEEGNERNDSCRHTGDDGPHDALDPRQHRALDILVGDRRSFDALRKHDRIIGEHPERHEQCEHRQQVQGHPGEIHDKDRAENRDDDSERHADRGPPMDSEEQEEKDKRSPLQCVRSQEREAILDELGEVAVRLDRHAQGSTQGTERPPLDAWRSKDLLAPSRRQLIPSPCRDIAARELCHVHRVLLPSPEDRATGRWLAVEPPHH